MITEVLLLHEPQRTSPWVVRWWGEPDPETGKQKRYGRFFRHHREAKAFLVHKQNEIDEGLPRAVPGDVSLGRLVTEFEETRLSDLSYASQIGYRNTLTQLLGYFGRTRKLQTIEQRHAEAFTASRKRQDGRPGELSRWARARHLIHSRALFGAAVEWGYIESNPFSSSSLRGRSSLRIVPKSKPWHHLTPTEFAQLLAVVPDVRQRAAYWLMYGCGLRPGEAYNTMATNVDLDCHRVHIVNREPTDCIPPFTVKADSQSAESKERTVPIPEAAIADLTEAAKRSFKSGGFLVLGERRFDRVTQSWQLCYQGKPWGGHAWRPWQNRDMLNNLLRDTKRYLQQAGIKLTAPFNLHAFRKSFAQNHADAGTPPRTLAKLLGHSNTRITMQYYARVTDANERAAAEAMNRLLRAPRPNKDAV